TLSTILCVLSFKEGTANESKRLHCSLQNKVFTYLFPFVLSVFNLQKLIAQQSKFTHSDYMIKAAEFFANTAASNFSFLYFMDCLNTNI
ncbi:MAG: hypothetical protein RR625_06160, partial [Christensenellaceae bacterium]